MEERALITVFWFDVAMTAALAAGIGAAIGIVILILAAFKWG